MSDVLGFDQLRAMRFVNNKPRNLYRFTDESETTVEMQIVKSNKTHLVLFDSASLSLLSQYTWYVDFSKDHIPYARTFAKDQGRKILMHRMLMADAVMVDHINGQSLDNRMINLRKATAMINSNNMKTNKLNKTGVNGVRLSKISESWLVDWRNSEGRKMIKSFGFGTHKLLTKEEAFTKACLFRREVDVQKGCTNGQRPV